MEIQEVIAHENGLWAAARYFRDWLADFGAAGPPAAQPEMNSVREAIDAVIARGSPSPNDRQLLRTATDHALYLAQLYDAPSCDIQCLRKWLRGVEELAPRVDYTLAAADYVLDTYVWAITIEMQELRSLRKALFANWSMLRDMGGNGGQNSAEDSATLQALEENVRAMLARCRNLLITYGEI